MFTRNPRRPGICAAALLALAGCDNSPAQQEAPAPAATPPAETRASPVAQDAIPPAIQGRWGLVAADCEPGRADAKGLMVVTGDRLEFYESAGSLRHARSVTAESIAADFAFTGEGVEWVRPMMLTLEEGGTALIRTESGDGAMPDPLRYRRCPDTGT